MTLIAAIRPERVPILLGDLLLSSRLRPEHSLHLPTVGATSLAHDRFHLWGLDQKISIINQSAALAWCGSRSVAKNAISNARRYYLNHEVNLGTLTAFFGDQIPAGADVSFIIAFLDRSGGLGVCHYDAFVYETENFGSCTVAGSGQGHFSDLIYMGIAH